MYPIIKNDIAPFDESRLVWPWKLMDVGDCAIIDEEDPALLKKAQNACHVYGSKRGKKFKTKKEGEILKVWRIA